MKALQAIRTGATSGSTSGGSFSTVAELANLKNKQKVNTYCSCNNVISY